jgi:SnoaL-like domain
MRGGELLEELALRRVMDRYLACLDRRDFDGIAACFTDNASIVYLDGRVSLVGGRALADYLRFVTNFSASNHTVSSFAVQLDGATATMDTLAVAILLEGEADSGRLLVRGIHYQDRLVRHDEGWLIDQRDHGATWQCVGNAVARYLPHA